MNPGKNKLGSEYLSDIFSVTAKKIKEKDSESDDVKKGRIKRTRITLNLPIDVVEKLRDAVFWTPGLTMARLAEEALLDAIAHLEEKRGEPFPARTQNLSVGRPPR